MGFFAQADEVLDGNETARQAEYHVNCDEPPKLQPGKGGAVDPKPHRLTNNDVRIDRHLFWKSFMKKINNGKDGSRKRHESENEKSPPRPDIWKCLRDDIVQTAPANDKQ